MRVAKDTSDIASSEFFNRDRRMGTIFEWSASDRIFKEESSCNRLNLTISHETTDTSDLNQYQQASSYWSIKEAVKTRECCDQTDGDEWIRDSSLSEEL